MFPRNFCGEEGGGGLFVAYILYNFKAWSQEIKNYSLAQK